MTKRVEDAPEPADVSADTGSAALPATPSNRGARRWLIGAAIVVGAALLGLGLIAGHVNRELVDSRAFADHVDDIRQDDEVADSVGQFVSNQMVIQTMRLSIVLFTGVGALLWLAARSRAAEHERLQLDDTASELALVACGVFVVAGITILGVPIG